MKRNCSCSSEHLGYSCRSPQEEPVLLQDQLESSFCVSQIAANSAQGSDLTRHTNVPTIKEQESSKDLCFCCQHYCLRLCLQLWLKVDLFVMDETTLWAVCIPPAPNRLAELDLTSSPTSSFSALAHFLVSLSQGYQPILTIPLWPLKSICFLFSFWINFRVWKCLSSIIKPLDDRCSGQWDDCWSI